MCFDTYGASVSGAHPPFWFPIELASNCAQGDVAIRSGDFGILENKRSNVEFVFKVDLRPSIQLIVTKFITFSPSNHSHHLYFR